MNGSMMFVRSCSAALLACALFGLAGHRTAAGRCRDVGTPRQALERADAVFLGTVRKVDDAGEGRIAELDVERYWKGPGTKTVLVYTGKHLYGIRFRTGDRYLIYARYDEGEAGGERMLGTSRCLRSRAFEDARVDLKELGKGKAPE